MARRSGCDSHVSENERVVILQDAIMPYRRPFYDALAAYYDVCVIHSGLPSVTPGSRYRERIVPERRIGPFPIQAVHAAIGAEEPLKAVVTIFDVRRVATVWAGLRARAGRRLLWGHRYSHRRAVNRLRDLMMNRFDGVIQYGDEDTAQMIAHGIAPDRIFLAPNTIAVTNHEDCTTDTKHSLLFVGRLQERKRIDELLRAFAAIRDRLPSHVKLELVGDGALRTDLEALAATLEIADRTVFHGRIDDPQVLKRIFAAAYAYVSPDNVGLGVLHAFAYGVPVITSVERGARISGFRHGPEFLNIRPGENGLVVDDQAGLREAIEAIVTEPGLAVRLGSNAYRYYTEERSIGGMVDGFRRAIEGRTALFGDR